MNGLELATAYAAVMYAWQRHSDALKRCRGHIKIWDKIGRARSGGLSRVQARYRTAEKRRANKAQYKLQSLKPLKELLEYHLRDMEDGTVTRTDVKDLWPSWMTERGYVK